MLPHLARPERLARHQRRYEDGASKLDEWREKLQGDAGKICGQRERPMYRGALAAALVASCIVLSAQAQTASDLIGTWALESSVLVAGEKRTDQFGAGATGALTFDSTGHF